MAEGKELTKHDLSLIYKIDQKMNYHDHAKIKVLHDMMVTKGSLRASIGLKYLNRLQEISHGELIDACLICGKQITDPAKSVFCPSCTEKLRALSQPAKKEAFSEKSEELQNKVHSTVTSIGEKVNEANVKAVADTTKEMAKLNQKAKELAATTQLKEKLASPKAKKRFFGILAVIISFAILSAIGLKTIFMIGSLLGMALLLFNIIKKRPRKKAIILTCTFLILTAIAEAFGGGDSDNVVTYLGTPKEQVFKDYSPELFYTEYGILTNEGNAYQGKPYVAMQSDKVCDIVITSGMNSSWNVEGIHIGDSQSEVKKKLKKMKATTRDSDVVIEGKKEVYHFKKSGREIQLIIQYSGDIVEKLNITTE